MQTWHVSLSYFEYGIPIKGDEACMLTWNCMCVCVVYPSSSASILTAWQNDEANLLPLQKTISFLCVHPEWRVLGRPNLHAKVKQCTRKCYNGVVTESQGSHLSMLSACRQCEKQQYISSTKTIHRHVKSEWVAGEEHRVGCLLSCKNIFEGTLPRQLIPF